MTDTREWRARNVEHVRAYSRRRYDENRERFIAEAIERQKRNPERHQLLQKAGAANRRYPGKILLRDIDFILERDGRVCYWCKKDGLENRDFTLEHLKPINDVRFLTIACLACNTSRIAKKNGVNDADEKHKRAAANMKAWRERNKEHYRNYRREHNRRIRSEFIGPRMIRGIRKQLT